MKYRLPFFMSEVVLLILTGLSILEGLEWYVSFSIEMRGLICLINGIDPLLFLLLILINTILIGLYLWPEEDVLWWLNLVGLTSMLILLLNGDFSLVHVLLLLTVVFGTAYRRQLGLKHIWHWRGLLTVGIGLCTGFALTLWITDMPGFFDLY